ncbi:MAG: glycosyltransferase family protein [Polyangiaceae bacterium]
MRILYGLSGDGLGHTMRARVVAKHLVAQGHVVHMAANGRAARVLRDHGFDVIDVRGLVASYEKGGVSRAKTIRRFVCETPSRLRFNAKAALREELRFHPDLVITDFNGFACAVGHAFGAPVVSVDHQHVLDRFHHPRQVLAPFFADYAIARAAISAKTPRCDHYLVSSFFFPEEREKNRTPTTLVGPLVRPEFEALTVTTGDHVLVYQTAAGDPTLLEALKANRDTEFRVYGLGRTEKIKNVQLCAFDEANFLADLASARAVISNGGFSAISEALCLGKPILSVPLAHQPEQELNARWLEALDLGVHAKRATAPAIRQFLNRTTPYRVADERIRNGRRDGLAALDRILKEVA